MEYINAPWRARYVKNVTKTKGCIFCQALLQEDDRKAFILHRGRYNFVILNKYPYTPGHLMIASVQHLDSPEKTTKTASHELWDIQALCLKILRSHYRPQGFNIGMNLGKCAGAGITDHYHIHVIPRWPGDSNFMPLVGETRVVIESLETTFEQLSPLFREPV
jgi:ATP adenylyltransferase